jgi:hypothetical protein
MHVRMRTHRAWLCSPLCAIASLSACMHACKYTSICSERSITMSIDSRLCMSACLSACSSACIPVCLSAYVCRSEAHIQHSRRTHAKRTHPHATIKGNISACVQTVCMYTSLFVTFAGPLELLDPASLMSTTLAYPSCCCCRAAAAALACCRICRMCACMYDCTYVSAMNLLQPWFVGESPYAYGCVYVRLYFNM